jgi:putative transposase
MVEFDNKISRLNQILSCRKLGSNNWYKTKAKLNQTYNDKKNHIQDFLHKITTKIVTDFDEIYVGNVNSWLGLNNHKLAKSTADQHWYEIKRQLDYKSNWYDKVFKVVNEKYTSVTCSNCRHQLVKIGLSVREWMCINCGIEHDRDVNAAKNILTVGLTGLAFSKTDK